MRLLTAVAALLCCSFAAAQTPPPFAPPPAPNCVPLSTPGDVHVTTTPDGHVVAMLWCPMPDYTFTYNLIAGTVFDTPSPACAQAWAKRGNPKMAWIRAVWAACVTSTPDTATQALMDTMKAQWLPHTILVQLKGSPVVKIDHNGVETPRVIGGNNQLVSMDATGHCGGPGFKDKAGNLMFSVIGLTSDQGQVLTPINSSANLYDAAAACQIVFPPPGGWPQ